MDRPEHYIGDSMSAREEGGEVILARDFSDGRRREVRLDPVVLDEFLAWIEEREPPAWRAERA
jgi:hypothetical protein